MNFVVHSENIFLLNLACQLSRWLSKTKEEILEISRKLEKNRKLIKEN